MIYGVSLSQKKIKILLIGSSGTLGKTIAKNKFFSKAVKPSKKKLNITKRSDVKKYLRKDFQIIINCAAISSVKDCENKPSLAYKVNVNGVKNLVKEILEYKKDTKKNILLVHISSDAVYPPKRGNNSEKSKLIPYNIYGNTKYKSESIVKKLDRFTIIRTRFFDKHKIKFKDAATDIFSSMLEVKDIVRNIIFLLKIDYTGVINVGGKKISDFNAIKKFNKKIKKTSTKEILRKTKYTIATDASLNISLLKKLKKKYEKIRL